MAQRIKLHGYKCSGCGGDIYLKNENLSNRRLYYCDTKGCIKIYWGLIPEAATDQWELLAA